MQNKLDELYREYLEHIFQNKEIETRIENHKISSPQLLDITTPKGKYLESDYRIVFVGKETAGWFNKEQRDKAGLININRQFNKYIHALKSIYKEHDFGAKHKTPFFKFIELFIGKFDKTSSSNKSTGYLFTELLRHDEKGKGLSEALIHEATYNNNYILRKELEILNPDVLIFLTGPNYDRYIKQTYPNAVFKEIEGYSSNQASIIKNIPNVRTAVRIYHPRYLSYTNTTSEYSNLLINIIQK